MDNIKELLVRLEKAQREYPETHVLLGQTRTAVVALQDKVEELTTTVNKLKHNVAVIHDSLGIAIEFCEASAALKQAGK